MKKFLLLSCWILMCSLNAAPVQDTTTVTFVNSASYKVLISWNVAENAFNRAKIKVDDVKKNNSGEMKPFWLNPNDEFTFSVSNTAPIALGKDRFTLEVTPPDGNTCGIQMELQGGYLGIKKWNSRWSDVVTPSTRYHQGMHSLEQSCYSMDMPTAAAKTLLELLGGSKSNSVLLMYLSSRLISLNNGESFGGLIWCEDNWIIHYGGVDVKKMYVELKVNANPSFYFWTGKDRDIRFYATDKSGSELASTPFFKAKPHENVIDTLWLPYEAYEVYNLWVQPTSVTGVKKNPTLLSRFTFGTPSESGNLHFTWSWKNTEGPKAADGAASLSKAKMRIGGKKVWYQRSIDVPKDGDYFRKEVDFSFNVKM